MISIATLYRIAFRNVWRNRKRSTLTIGAIGVGILSSSMLSALQVGAREQIEQDSVRNLLGHVKIANVNYFDDPVALNSMQSLLQLNFDEQTKVSSRVRVSAVIMSERKSRPVFLVGINPFEEREVSVLDQSSQIRDGVGLVNDEDQGIVLGESLIADLKTEVGKRVVVLTQDKWGKVAERGFRIKGSYGSELKSVESAYAVSGIKTIQKMLKLDSNISDVSITLPDSSLAEEVRIQLSSSYPNLEVKTWKEVEPFLQAVVKLQNGVLILWYGIVVLTVFFGVINTLYMMVIEREREFCLYRALGLGNYSLILQILLEMFFLLFCGSLLGILLSYLIVGYLSSSGISLNLFSEGANLIGIRSVIYPKLVFSNLSFFVLLIFLICILGSILPARRAVMLSATHGLSK